MNSYRGPYWLLGLPFDAVTMEEAIDRIHVAAQQRSRLLFVTPNVNFVVMAVKDAAFRNTVLRSQLSLVDGTPLVWLGRNAGIPFPERVAGSSLLDRLARNDRPLRVYFFGGPPDAARLASERLPSLGRGLVPAGYHTPGFGSVESMSTPALIDSINNSGADFLVVALGAKKGHEWIARNADRIHTPVISHLGASINFLAGTIARAPAWMQTVGLEWIWRILQEPSLLRRYWDDGRHFASTAFAARNRRGQVDGELRRLNFLPQSSAGITTWILEGSLARDTAGALQNAYESARVRGELPAVLDVSRLVYIDAAGFGFLYAMLYRQQGTPITLACSAPAVSELFRRSRAEHLLDVATPSP